MKHAKLPTPARSEAEGRTTVRDVMARVLGEADAAQYRPSGNHPSLTALAEMEREQRVFKMITDAGVLYQAKWGNQS